MSQKWNEQKFIISSMTTLISDKIHLFFRMERYRACVRNLDLWVQSVL
jgi:hypothetical protein